ncbi:MAG: hypothetical protein HUU50_02465 [Candidatus Brocadiae bacterium]|nr:hypothetical protein [Candidatus Brocadiia bacterium]
MESNYTYLNMNDAWNGLGNNSNIYALIQDGENSGKFETASGIVENIDFILIALDRKRIMFEIPFDPNNTDPLCRSDNFTTPTGGKAMLPGPCLTCRNSQWRGEKKDRPPVCMEIYTMFGWDTVDFCPFIFYFKRTGIAALKKIKTLITFNSLKLAPEKGVPINLGMKLRMTSSPALFGSKEYFTPSIALVSKSEKETQALLLENIKEIMPLLVDKGNAMAITQAKEEIVDKVYQDEQPAICCHPPQNVIAGMPPDIKNYSVIDSGKEFILPCALPNIKQNGWWADKVRFGKAANMTWYELMTNQPMPDGKPGRSYLHALSAWEEFPDIQVIAKEAIRLGREWEARGLGDPPF